MVGSLVAVQTKLDRAKEHLVAVDAEQTALVGPDTYRTVLVQKDTEGRRYGLRIEGLGPIPTRFAAIVGDCLNNCRSVLDYLACLFVVAQGGRVTEQTAFPIKTQPPKGDLQISGLSSKAPAMADILALQPYSGPEPDTHPLAWLNALNNFDKHQQLLFNIVTHGGMAVPIPADRPAPGGVLSDVTLKDRDELTEFYFPPPWTREEITNFKPGIGLGVKIDPALGFHRSVTAGMPVTAVLDFIVQTVEKIVLPRLAPLC